MTVAGFPYDPRQWHVGGQRKGAIIDHHMATNWPSWWWMWPDYECVPCEPPVIYDLNGDMEDQVEEAPMDGKAYVRMSGAWVEALPPGIDDAPADGSIYGRQNSLWAKVPLSSAEYSFSTQITPPGSGGVRVNNADQTLAFKLFIAKITDDGKDITLRLQGWTTGDRVYIQDKNNSEIYQQYNLTGPAVDGGGYFEWDVTWVDGSTPIGNNQDVLVFRA